MQQKKLLWVLSILFCVLGVVVLAQMFNDEGFSSITKNSKLRPKKTTETAAASKEISLPKINRHVEILDFLRKTRISDNRELWFIVSVKVLGQCYALINLIDKPDIPNDMNLLEVMYVLQDQGDKRLICSSFSNEPDLIVARDTTGKTVNKMTKIPLNPIQKLEYANLCNQKGEELLQLLNKIYAEGL